MDAAMGNSQAMSAIDGDGDDNDDDDTLLYEIHDCGHIGVQWWQRQ